MKYDYDYRHTIKGLYTRLSKKGTDFLNEELDEIMTIYKALCSSEKNISVKDAIEWYQTKRNEANFSNQKYYHYTDVNGVIGIFNGYINSKKDNSRLANCSMRASQIRFLNDAMEFKNGLEAFDKFQEEFSKYDWWNDYINGSQSDISCIALPPQFSRYSKFLPRNFEHDCGKKTLKDTTDGDVYSISFCGNGDLLSQWKWYGKKSGVAIEFNLDKICYRYWDAGIEDESYDDITKPLSVMYSDEAKKILFVQSCTRYNEEYVSVTYPDKNFFVLYCKDIGFEEEKESRLIFRKRKDSHIKYYVSDDKIKPTLDVNFLLLDETEQIVESFTVGPGKDQQLVFNALIHIFDDGDFLFCDEVEIKEIPKHKEDTSFADHKVHKVICDDGMVRETYKCNNGIYIYKSNIPFRG